MGFDTVYLEYEKLRWKNLILNTVRGENKMCVIWGYARKSKPKQDITRQLRNILAYNPEAKIIEEAYTGTTINRKEWNKLFTAAKQGDTIIFDSVSRMSRNAEEGYAAYEALYNRGVELVFLNEPHINTATFKNALAKAVPMTGTAVDYILEGINKYLMELAKEQIFLAFQQAEKEVADLHTRTAQGVLTAKLNGRVGGFEKGTKLITKKSIAQKEVLKKHCIDFGGSLNDIEVMQMTGLSRNTYYKYKRELREELSK